MTEQVTIERDGAVMIVRLARPEKKNALTGAMYDKLTASLIAAEEDETIGAILIAGSGGSFCAGNDLFDFLSYAGQPGEKPPFRFIKALAAQTTPLVAAVEGVAVGIGTTMLLHCDLVYAAPSAVFRLPFVDLGIVPEAGSTLLLPRRVGMAKASELLLLAEPFDASEALRLDLVNAVLPAEALFATALAKAQALAAKPRNALAATRKFLRGDTGDVLAAIEAEGRAFEAALASPEARAAFEKFLSKPKAAAGA